MAANTKPIYTLGGDQQWGSSDGNGGAAGPLKTANTAKDGTGTVLTVWTADAANGGYCRSISFCSAGTNVATAARVFENNGGTNATLSNNSLIKELTLGATTLSEVQAQPPYEIPINRAFQPGYKINVTLGTTVAAGYFPSVDAGKY